MTDLPSHLQEGVHDPYIFKALFMAGAPGSGKSTVRDQLFGGMGLKLVDADEVRRAYLNLGKGGDYDVYGAIVRKQRQNYAEQRLGIIMDTTAWWPSSIFDTTQQLRALGYDVGMLHVFVPLNMSLQRAQARAERTGRVVPEQEIIKRYQGLHDNVRNYAELFGDQFWFVDNTGDHPRLDLVRRHLLQWLRTPVNNPVAREWTQQHTKPIMQENQARKVSAGVIITDGLHVLLGHVTGDTHWDLPKGGIDSGESAVQAAVRELREETGLRVHPQQLQYLGRSRYTKQKDLELFAWVVPQMPDVTTLHCTSQFKHAHGQWLPELDDFAVVPRDKVSHLVKPNMAQVIDRVWSQISFSD
jgi:8-oxo-dGTP pyrophosphatase MutT (NUDIX family)/predicted ABC-type ATPase